MRKKNEPSLAQNVLSNKQHLKIRHKPNMYNKSTKYPKITLQKGKYFYSHPSCGLNSFVFNLYNIAQYYNAENTHTKNKGKSVSQSRRKSFFLLHGLILLVYRFRPPPPPLYSAYTIIYFTYFVGNLPFFLVFFII